MMKSSKKSSRQPVLLEIIEEPINTDLYTITRSLYTTTEFMPSKASIDIRVKCKETGCYLFLYKNDKLEEFI